MHNTFQKCSVSNPNFNSPFKIVRCSHILKVLNWNFCSTLYIHSNLNQQEIWQFPNVKISVQSLNLRLILKNQNIDFGKIEMSYLWKLIFGMNCLDLSHCKQLTDLSPSFPGWRPAATMYVLPMVLIFSKTLNFGLERS